mgnify:FL=1
MKQGTSFEIEALLPKSFLGGRWLSVKACSFSTRRSRWIKAIANSVLGVVDAMSLVAELVFTLRGG